MPVLGTYMKATSCQFCGIATDVPHETQEACIEALHQEIARVRGILENSTPSGQRPVMAPDDHGPDGNSDPE